MAALQKSTKYEQAGLVLSLLLLMVGIAELTDVTDVLPVYVYLFVMWVLAVAMWAHARQR